MAQSIRVLGQRYLSEGGDVGRVSMITLGGCSRTVAKPVDTEDNPEHHYGVNAPWAI